MTDEPLVRVDGLTKRYPVATGFLSRNNSFIHAVDGVSFELAQGESFGLVGESGCGKTTTGKLLVKLTDPTEGSIFFNEDGDATDIAKLKGRDLKRFRRRAQMIFQDPYESMNPRRTIFDTVAEPLSVQKVGGPMERLERVSEILELVGLTPPRTFLFRYPHELSGGQRQRIAIARALVIDPTFVVADEPTSMLDVSIRTGIMGLMESLADRLGVTYLYITHDLAVARYMCNRIAVMYLGKIVETGETEEVLHNPLHPYTKALLSAVPIPDPGQKRKVVEISGGVSMPIDPLPRCRFYDRCPVATDRCRDDDHPSLEDMGSGHMAACYNI
ncbi:MAG: ABC transporter ATP-binding protein [SAR202 cluster bacterium]|jgi:peptide/nickel transport system ATP-binding protein|nr:ABC transporter ATP-binding protein [SAR202 cluster bacterium]